LQSGNVVKINYGRLTLCEITAQVLAKCFDILGLKFVEKM
jgi:arginyl-tRNA synthetase